MSLYCAFSCTCTRYEDLTLISTQAKTRQVLSRNGEPTRPGATHTSKIRLSQRRCKSLRGDCTLDRPMARLRASLYSQGFELPAYYRIVDDINVHLARLSCFGLSKVSPPTEFDKTGAFRFLPGSRSNFKQLQARPRQSRKSGQEYMDCLGLLTYT